MRRAALWWGLALAAAAAIRLAGIQSGLPRTYNADEPHLVNLAVSFGGGSLRPYAFKYPTLWPYLLFFFYGLYFLVWSGAGLARGLGEFAGLFAWNPGGFYLIGRLSAAAFSLLAAGVVWRLERETRDWESWPWAALLIAFCPVIVELAHTCKPDCLMLFLACAGWYAAHRVLRDGDRRGEAIASTASGARPGSFGPIPASSAVPRRSRPPWTSAGAWAPPGPRGSTTWS